MSRVLRTAAATMIVIASLSTTGCGFACNEAGWVNTLEVQVPATAGELPDAVEVCFDGECIPGTLAETEESDHSRWVFELGVAAPHDLTVRTLDSSASELPGTEVEITWTPTWSPNGPGCENGSVTEPIVIDSL